MRYLLVTILALSASAFAQTDEQRAAIADRIKSFSNVCVAGEDCGGAAAAGAMEVAALPGEASTPDALRATALTAAAVLVLSWRAATQTTSLVALLLTSK